MAQVIKRSWSKKSQISEHTDVLDIWDSGSHIFERWPDGREYYWKVISRKLTENGFIETLKQMPQWQMPGQILRREQIPLLQISPSQFQMGAWNVEQVAFDRTETSEGNSRQNKPQALPRPASKKHFQKEQKEQKAQIS